MRPLTQHHVPVWYGVFQYVTFKLSLKNKILANECLYILYPFSSFSTALVALCFAICWLPFHIIRIMPNFKYESWSEMMRTIYHEGLYYFSIILLYMSSTINPILYNVMSARFRQAFRRTILCQDVRQQTPQTSQAYSTITRTYSFDDTTVWKYPKLPTNIDPLRIFIFLYKKYCWKLPFSVKLYSGGARGGGGGMGHLSLNIFLPLQFAQKNFKCVQ